MDEKERHLLGLIGGITFVLGLLLGLYALWITI
jgi:hypothetical protein